MPLERDKLSNRRVQCDWFRRDSENYRKQSLGARATGNRPGCALSIQRAMMPLYRAASRWHNRPVPMRHLQCLLVTAGISGLVGCSSVDRAQTSASRQAPLQLPGIQEDGAVRLPNQWFLRPVGKQIVVGDFPVNLALHPGGKFAAVLHCGNGPNEIVVLEIPGGRLV